MRHSDGSIFRVDSRQNPQLSQLETHKTAIGVAACLTANRALRRAELRPRLGRKLVGMGRAAFIMLMPTFRTWIDVARKAAGRAVGTVMVRLVNPQRDPPQAGQSR
ncbi:MAG: hypothetical protein D6753_16540 [Planctomycetota bacterium]|nr:MAG: hypothetical protein D6753_16540 [Planctomycetota bacterium]